MPPAPPTLLTQCCLSRGIEMQKIKDIKSYRINGLAPIYTIGFGCMNIQQELLVIDAIMFTSSKEVTESAEPTLVCFVIHPLGVQISCLRSLSTIGMTRF
jgi:hypothetical protein